MPNYDWRKGSNAEGLVVEAWGQGYYIGSLIIMACITIAAMRRGVLLHKLILAEQLLALPHGFFCFMTFQGYGYYVSSTFTILILSYLMHNIVSWLKVRPFFIGKRGNPTFFNPRTGKIVRWVYLVSLGVTIPVWIFYIYNSFRWNHNGSGLYPETRPYEFLNRDPWWVFTNIVLLHVIGKTYGMNVTQLLKISPRLCILLVAILLALCFTVLDVAATVVGPPLSSVDGINPYWKLSLVFKCLTDAIMLDDFATELQRIGRDRKMPDHIRQNDGGMFVRDKNMGSEEPLPPKSDPAVSGPTSSSSASKDLDGVPPGRYTEAYSLKKTNSSPRQPDCLEIEDIGGLASSV